MAELQVSIVSPSRIVAKATTDYLQVPSINGYLGIMPGHTAYVTELGLGELKIGQNGESFFISGGYLDVHDDKVTVMVDVAERPSEIDKIRAESAKKRALDRLEKKVEVDIMRAQAALARAQARIDLSSARR